MRTTVDGALELVPDAIAKVLQNSAEPRREGIDRYIRDGRIERYPVRPTERREVLERVADQVMQRGEVLTEPKCPVKCQ